MLLNASCLEACLASFCVWFREAGVGSKSSAWLEAQKLADKISKLVQVLVDVEDAMDECEVKSIL